MLVCDETVTLIRHVPEKDTDVYICTVIHGASWYGKTKIELQDHGLVAAQEVKVRIPTENMPEGVEPQEGDFLLHGEVSRIGKQAELEAYEHIRVMTAGNNRRGRFPHWAVIGT